NRKTRSSQNILFVGKIYSCIVIHFKHSLSGFTSLPLSLQAPPPSKVRRPEVPADRLQLE
ncbi:MAG: hypothetical protein QNL11_00580, partial [Desulfobacterales bacterium]|nr:hypothetical protein [Desulfobacterales bacterium]